MTTPATTAARLRAAIAADCPHRLTDYDTHLAAISQPTPAFLHLWRIEHATSSNPTLEQQLHDLEHQAARADADEGRRLLAEYSRIRREIAAATLDPT